MFNKIQGGFAGDNGLLSDSDRAALKIHQFSGLRFSEDQVK